jgi:hypothetical protein
MRYIFITLVFFNNEDKLSSFTSDSLFYWLQEEDNSSSSRSKYVELPAVRKCDEV